MSQENVPNAWLTRAGRHGRDEAAALEQGLAILGYDAIPDLSRATSTEEMLEIVRSVSPGASESNMRNVASQLAAFALRMQKGDTVVLPLKIRSGYIALGRVTGPYARQEISGQQRHTRPVEWVRPAVQRSDFQQDLLYSLGAFMTVCRIQRNAAAARLHQMLSGKKDPGPPPESPDAKTSPGGDIEPLPTSIDISQLANDQIVARIEGRFRGHELARLVNAVLCAEGYFTQMSPPGRDGGVDILAGRGSLGLDSPRLCVQVKSSSSPSDVNVLRALQGTMQNYKAEQGLLVSWGGVTGGVLQEARQSFFAVRIWDASALVEALYRTYDRLPEEIQADLPLKRIWALVLEESTE